MSTLQRLMAVIKSERVLLREIGLFGTWLAWKAFDRDFCISQACSTQQNTRANSNTNKQTYNSAQSMQRYYTGNSELLLFSEISKMQICVL